MHEWKHTPGVTRALSSTRAAAGRRLPSSFSPSCHFPHPLPLSRRLPNKHQHLNLNATSGAQIKSFTVHREQRRLATIQPAGESACFLSAPTPPSPPTFSSHAAALPLRRTRPLKSVTTAPPLTPAGFECRGLHLRVSELLEGRTAAFVTGLYKGSKL